ncbi:DUF7507 domain-containing protein [Actinocrispum wychmicini]|uniref:Putative repeat protein (TIGR01451 family)/fimbrial isopeptide formation D2 family protein n=1 Tax=Actinocrispum wychmicini TaxID=1213861 RepID=A0A4R2JRC4_9PSEU|nr:hypothetical protein [Actinocrispum wychmicini]TCO62801.1 putative repeat protein (TIGR01451 family)/fimbrial isopeptide formation D2 family protein [Actinocrispum wychmicini]
MLVRHGRLGRERLRRLRSVVAVVVVVLLLGAPATATVTEPATPTVTSTPDTPQEHPSATGGPATSLPPGADATPATSATGRPPRATDTPTTSTPSSSAEPTAPAASPGPQSRGAGTERPIGPVPVYSGLAHGGITMAANSVVQCAPGVFCDAMANNANSVSWIKVDPAAPGNTASTARLNLPAGAKVLNARLYWQFNPVGTGGFPTGSGDGTVGNKVSVKAPGSTTYTSVTATSYDWFDALGSGFPTLYAYGGAVDVTSLVTAAGAGDYTVADIQACQGQSANRSSNLGCWGGWSLVAAYELPSEPLRYLQVWDGLQKVAGGGSPASAVISLSGIKAPASRQPNVALGIVAGDGDANITGDYLEVGQDAASLQRISVPAPAGVVTNNAFSSRIDEVTATGSGTNVTTRDPNPVNNVGYDSRTIDITGKVPAGASQLQVKIGTTGDALYPQVVWLVTDALEPDLQITKANDPPGNTNDAPPGYVTKGQEVAYTFDVANKHADGTTNDLDTATNVVLTDTLPAGVTYVAGSNPDCSATGQVVTCRLRDLGPGQSQQVGFKVKVGPDVPDGTKLDNTGQLTFRGKDTGRPQERTSNTVRNTVTSPKYQLTKSVDRPEAVPGDILTYTVTLRNTGFIPVPALTVRDTLPPGTSYLSATPSKGTASGSGPIDWAVPGLAVGETVTLTVKVRVEEAAIGKDLVNRAAVPIGPPPVVPPDNRCPDDPAAACVTTKVPAPSYTVKKTADKQSANPGDTVRYTVTVTNTGRVTAAGLKIVDDLTGVLDDADYQNDASATTGTVSYATPKVTWAGSLAAGEKVTVTYSVKVKKPNPGNNKLVNAVSSDNPGGNCPPGSTDPDCSTTTPVSGLEIKKSVDKSSANPGDVVKYTVTVKNTGQTPYSGATFTDDLTQVLDDADYQNDGAATVGAVSYVPPKLTWTGNVAVGQTVTVTYSVKVKNPNPGDHKLINAVSSETPGGDCPPGSTDPDCSTTTPVSGLEIKKVADKPSANPGDVVKYTVTVKNTGQTPYSGATFTDDLTQVLDDADYQNDGAATVGSVSYAAPKLTWRGDVPVGQTVTVTYSVKVKKPNPGDNKLVNAVSSDTPGGNCPPGSKDPACTTTTPVSGLEIKKSVDKSSANPGDVVKYTVTVRNTGQTPYSGATFTDDLTQVLDDADYQNDGAATAGAVTYAAPKLTWSGDVAVGGTVTVTYSVKVKNPNPGDHKLINGVSSDTPGGDCPPGSTDPDCSTTTPVSGLEIKKVVDKASANPGDVVKYTVTVKNTGQTKQTGATFTDDLTQVLDDADYQNDGAGTAGVVTYAAPKLTWVGDIPVGQTVTVTYSVKVKNPNHGDHKLINAISTDTPGGNCPPGSTDPDCSTTTPVSGLLIRKVADKESADPGDVVKYTITVKNTGQTRQNSASFTDDLTQVLDDADYQNDAAATTGTLSYAAPKLSWNGPLGIGEQATVTYTVKIKNPNPGDKKLTNVVTSDTPGNNCPPGSTDPNCTTTLPSRELTIKKTSDKQSANPGDVVTYTVTVTNTGKIDLVGAEAARVTDDLTAVLDDADYQNDAKASPVAGGFVFTAPNLVWTGDLLVGQSTTLTYSVKVKNPVTGDHKLRNGVSSNTPGNCPPESDNPDCSTTTPVAGLEIKKTVDKSSANPGDVVKYTVTVKNTGQTKLTGATFTDDLTQVLDDADYQNDGAATAGAVSYVAPKLTWTGDVAVGETVTVTYSVKVKKPNPGDNKLVNAVSSETPGGNCPPGSKDPACTTTTPVSGMEIKKTVDKTSVNPGDVVKYTVTVRNTGQTPYSGATFTDDLTQVLDDADYQNDGVATAGAVTYAAPKLTWSGDVAVGGTVTVTYSVKVKNPNPGDHKLINAVSSKTPGGDCPPGSTDPDCSTTTLVSGLEIKKVVDKSSANPGDVVKYTVTVKNTGQTPYSGATFTDDLTQVLDDADYQNDVAATAGVVTYVAPKLSWSGDVAVGGTVAVTYSVKVKNPNPGDNRLKNAVSSETPGGDCPPGSTDPDCSTTTPVSGLEIKKTVDKSSANPGDVVKYTVTVKNTGQTPYSGATFTDDLTQVLDDADYQNDGAATAGVVTYAAPKLTWTGDVAVGGTVTVTYSVRVKKPNPGDNKLVNVVSSDTPGGNCPPGSKDPACTTTTPVSGLEIKKTVDKSSVNPGDVVKYTVTVRNTGQTPYSGATFTDDLTRVLDDADYQNDGAATAGVITYAAPKLTWSGDVAVGGMVTVTYSVKVKNPNPGDHKLVNAVSSETPGGDCPPGSTDPDCSTTTPVSGLEIKKTVDKSSVNPGDVVKYTVTVKNTGQTPYSGATFTDDLTQVLDDADYQNDAAATAGSVMYTPPKLTWTGDLAIGQTVTVTYSVKVKNPNPGDNRLKNAVSSETPGGDCPPGSTDPDCSTTTPVSGLEIKKTVDKASANPGDVVKYTVTVKNTGQTPYSGATFTDDLTQVLDDADYQNDGAATAGSITYAAPKLTWTGDVAVGGTVTVTYSVKVKKPNSGDHKLVNAVSSETPGGDCPPGSTDPDCSTTTPVSGLEIKKTVDKTSANPGDVVKYTVTVRNTGQTTLDGATFTDDLSGVLDDATYSGDAKATVGTVTYAEPKLTWKGDLGPGVSAVVNYSVTVKSPPTGDRRLRNVVTSDTPGGDCPPGSTDPDCGTDTSVPPDNPPPPLPVRPPSLAGTGYPLITQSLLAGGLLVLGGLLVFAGRRPRRRRS